MLRVLAGLMIFYIHGWHKLEGLVASLKDGTPWKLVEEVSGMHFPAPMISAIAATVIQFICSLLMTVGFLTRINAALLSGVLGVALLQNLLANRDPQLTIVYLLIVVFFAFQARENFPSMPK